MVIGGAPPGREDRDGGNGDEWKRDDGWRSGREDVPGEAGDAGAHRRGGDVWDEGSEVSLPARGEPWVETPAGGLFFVNAVLVAPELVVLFPLLMGWILRGLGLLEGSSRFIDTIPLVAAYVLPWTGWMLVIPLWTVWRNLRMEDVGRAARTALYGMACLHALFLGYTVWRWFGA